MDSSVEMKNFGQYYGESLMDALFRKRNERIVEEVKMLNEVKEPLLG